MNHSRNFKASLVMATLLSFSVAQAATMNKAEYKAEKTRISADCKLDKKACASFKDNAEDMPMPGQANNHSTLAAKATQKATATP